MVKNLKKWILPISLVLFAAVSLFVVGSVITAQKFHISSEVLDRAESKYGKESVERLKRWENLINTGGGSTDMEKLKTVNGFFNGLIQFVNDIDMWGRKDYWATPLEFLSRCAGDCEDFAISKFFTLKAMGMNEEKLNITYVKALQYNIHHMVLTYYSQPGAEPLVLDNLIDTINPASKRTDLMPIFSFNGTGLWLAKQRGKGKFAGSSSKVKAWGDLQRRMMGNEL